VTLPGMSGADLARRVRDLQPDTRVLLVSGYGDKAEIGEPIPGVRVLAKPIDLSILQKELADLADQA
jgi:CheY-like chemotaxis protein